MSLRSIVACLLLVIMHISSASQVPETRNIIVVTLDGLRWKELFEGADSAILFNKKYVKDRQILSLFQGKSNFERRSALMPFMWDVIARKGQLYGNRNLGNKVNCVNHHLISYPGYAEMLVGFKHHNVSSNRKIENPHPTVLEVIQQDDRFKNEVAAFATWDVFPYILRESRSDIYVNAGKDLAQGNLSRHEQLLNDLQTNGKPRSDSMTFYYALEYLKRERPRVILIGLDQTDQSAHDGRYDEYLHFANQADQMIAQLWQWVQSQPDYRDQTTLFITTDHGRGNGRNNWRSHRLLARGSRHIWFAVIGPDTPAFGEMKIQSRTYQRQVAKTIAAFLGVRYRNEEPVGEVVQTMISIPQTTEGYPSSNSMR